MILKGKKLLVVKKKGLDPFISPGGKPEPGETEEQTLRRELREELGVEVRRHEFFGAFRGKTIPEGAPLEVKAFFAEIAGEPKPQREIEGLAWIGRDDAKGGISLTPILEKGIVPELVRRGLL